MYASVNARKRMTVFVQEGDQVNGKRRDFKFLICLLYHTVHNRCFLIVVVLERKYTKKHEWVSVDGELGTVGITDFAAEQLGDVVFVELPDVETKIVKGDATGAVESVKAASDIYAPVSGVVTEKNNILEQEPGKINKSPFEEGTPFILS
uniref:Glycine cleavage system H protein n=1 Tax=Angiostrongylus cantonensis TaxID=6313 RepID=A0A0K0DRI7_ANGCA